MKYKTKWKSVKSQILSIAFTPDLPTYDKHGYRPNENTYYQKGGGYLRLTVSKENIIFYTLVGNPATSVSSVRPTIALQLKEELDVGKLPSPLKGKGFEA